MSGVDGLSLRLAGNGIWKAVLAALVASPLAILFGAKTPPSANADPAPAASAIEVAGPASSAPPDDCVRRFLAPLEQLAGEAHQESAAVSVETIEGRLESGVSFQAKLSSDKPEDDDWIQKTKRAVDTLRGMLGTGSSVDAMIATIADPIDSGLDYHFDTTLQALRLGAEHGARDGKGEYAPFYRDRSWLPWHDTGASGATPLQAAECRETIPGVMLFRTSDSKAPQLRLLLLVGETPTSGLHVRAMLNALRLTRALNEKCVAPAGAASAGADPSDRWAPSCATKIVGPTFSGTAFSMRLALEKWAREAESEPALVHIVTGSATGAGLPKTLGAKAGWPAPLRVWFEATTVPERAIECAYLMFLKFYLGADVAPTGPTEQGDASRRLSNVAMLHESGTEFGASTVADSPCNLRSAVDISFPAHISSLRDAYEDLDRKEDRQAKEAIARPTSLDVSLRERHRPLDAQADPSPKTTYAQDIALANVLTQISVEKVRHVGIHATDVADAIFLARKIRDVAPDVRLAFFETDALLLHPSFQRDLRGSLVVSPYPFLGSSHFGRTGSKGGGRVYTPFENAPAEGTFNAVLATRGWDFSELWEYTLPGSKVALPVWRSAIGSGGIVPLSFVPPLDCAGTVYRKGDESSSDEPPAQEVCTADKAERGVAWRKFNTLRTSGVTSDVTLPRHWHFLFGLLILLFIVDQIVQQRTRLALAPDAMPHTISRATDRQADLAIGRTKWLLYAGIRTFLFVLAFVYMGIIYAFSWFVGSPAAGMRPVQVLQLLVMVLALSASVICTLRADWRFAESYESFARAVRARSLIGWLCRRFQPTAHLLGRAFESVAAKVRAPRRERPASTGGGRAAGAERAAGTERAGCDPRRPDESPPTSRNGDGASDGRFFDRVSTSMGFATPESRRAVAQTSFSQLRIIVGLAVVLSTLLTALLVFATLDAADWTRALEVGAPVPALTLLVLRTVSFASGLSPAAPALLCVACVYAWAAGRMARLAAAHGIARMSPEDGEADMVSTPLRVVLYPSRDARSDSDGGFTHVERAVANAIWRPITGPFYLFAVIVVIVIPLVLFALKPLATLESGPGTWLLGGGLALSASLLGITLIQLVRYWLALELLLKRTMEHRLGLALSSVRPFVQESVDAQLSRSPNDLLRLVGCSRLFAEFVEVAGAPERCGLAKDSVASFEAQCVELEASRIRALTASSSGTRENAAASEAMLGQQIVVVASHVTRLLERAWEGDDTLFASAEEEAQGEQVEEALAAGDDTGFRPAAPDRSDQTRATRRRSGPVARSGADTGVHVPRWPAGIPRDRGERSDRGRFQSGSAEAVGPAREGRENATDALGHVAWRFPEEVEWLRAGQTFVVTVVALIVSRYVRQFKYFLYAMTASVVLLLLAIISYPFEPYRLLLTCIWGIVGSVVGASVWIFIELDRNTLMSHIAGSVPGKLTFDGAFVLRILAWGLLPVLSVAAAAYPEIANVLYRLVEPFVRAFR